MRQFIWATCLRRTVVLFSTLMTIFIPKYSEAGPRYSSRIVDTHGGNIRGVILELNSRHLEPVEVFRGIPYAAPPIGELRYRLPQPVVRWSGTKLADTFGAVCPQRYPDISNRTAALQFMPKGRYHYLKKFVPHLVNQSEDCLFLNLYIPGSGNRGLEAPYAVMVYVHGESFEWGSGNPYDGSVLASYGHVIMVTLNYRLGILGFLKTSRGLNTSKNNTSGGNLALYDIAAALRWIRDNIGAFGGDPTRVTLIGHDTGAALVNLLLISTIAKGLFTRVMLLSGSAISPWATIHNADAIRYSVGKQFGCMVVNKFETNTQHNTTQSNPPSSKDIIMDDIAPCLRKIPIEVLLDVRLENARFMPRIAPFLPIDAITLDPGFSMEHSSESFITCELMLGVTSTESYSDFNAADIQYGFEEDQRNRILRTYIRNAYIYHLNEIFSAVRNEYTDWDKPIQHPINIRDSTMEALSDGHTVSPLIRVAYLHSRRGAKTYFFHFGYQTKDSDYPQRLGSIRGEDITYLLGMPLVGGLPYFPQNFTRQDMGVAEAVLNFFTNFAKTGDPNEPREHKNDYGTVKEKTRYRDLVWETYETGSQQYLSIALKPRMKSHYRGHKMAVWLNLIPQLHQPGDDDVSMRHHHFHEREQHYYAGAVRPESFTRLPPPLHPASITDQRRINSGAGSTECVPTNELEIIDDDDDTSLITDDDTNDDENEDEEDAQLLERLATRHYYSYTAALGVTVGVGCLLLLLNMLIFAGIYYQRGRDRRKRQNSLHMSASSENIPMQQRPVLNNQTSQQQQQQPQSPTTVIGAHVIKVHEPPPCYATVNKTNNHQLLPEHPPPPPKKTKTKNCDKPKPPLRTSSVPSGTYSASSSSAPNSPTNMGMTDMGTNTIKKRVQIQEISV